MARRVFAVAAASRKGDKTDGGVENPFPQKSQFRRTSEESGETQRQSRRGGGGRRLRLAFVGGRRDRGGGKHSRLPVALQGVVGRGSGLFLQDAG